MNEYTPLLSTFQLFIIDDIMETAQAKAGAMCDWILSNQSFILFMICNGSHSQFFPIIKNQSSILLSKFFEFYNLWFSINSVPDSREMIEGYLMSSIKKVGHLESEFMQIHWKEQKESSRRCCCMPTFHKSDQIKTSWWHQVRVVGGAGRMV